MKKISITLALLLIATASFAQDAPKPNPKLKELQPFAGTFKCAGKAIDAPGSPEHPTAATVNARWSNNNFWLMISYKESKTTKNAHPYGGDGFWGFDEETKKFVSGWVDNMGGYQIAESAGFEGDAITWLGPNHFNGKTYKSRDVFTKKGTSIHHTYETEMDGKWMQFAEETCKK